jgi:hypothetical protein
MELRRLIKEAIRGYAKDSGIERIRDIGFSYNKGIEGGFLDSEEVKSLEREIESKYVIDVKDMWDKNYDDIRIKLFNYDNPMAEADINGVNLRIASGLNEVDKVSGVRRPTFLLYADGKIVGKFYKVEDVKRIVKYITDRLIKGIEGGVE